MSERINSENMKKVLEIFSSRFPEQFGQGTSLREQHAHSTTLLDPQLPDGVFFPESVEDVQQAVCICADHGMPIIAFGAGTSVEGHINAPMGGISFDMSRMAKILSVNSDDLDCTVEAGVTREELNRYLRDTGLFFPIDPGANATIGGMAATRASGTNAVRYGTMRDNVISLTVVLADGRKVVTASRARKSSAGYDLTRLFVGSEGTLGIICSATLRLHGIPQAVSGGICQFPTVDAAAQAVILTVQMGIPVARIELLNSLAIRAVNAYSGLDYNQTPCLFLEFHGSEQSVAEQANLFSEIASDFEGGPFKWTSDSDERSKLWKARHDFHWAALALRPGSKVITTDICVPVSRLAEAISDTERDSIDSGLIAPIVGHVGDGNFHVAVLIDPNDSQELQRAENFVSRLNSRAIAMDGTCSGEHGIGQGKIPYLLEEHGRVGVDVMRSIKQSLDPQNIMNPAKIFL